MKKLILAGAAALLAMVPAHSLASVYAGPDAPKPERPAPPSPPEAPSAPEPAAPGPG